MCCLGSCEALCAIAIQWKGYTKKMQHKYITSDFLNSKNLTVRKMNERYTHTICFPRCHDLELFNTWWLIVPFLTIQAHLSPQYGVCLVSCFLLLSMLKRFHVCVHGGCFPSTSTVPRSVVPTSTPISLAPRTWPGMNALSKTIKIIAVIHTWQLGQ